MKTIIYECGLPNTLSGGFGDRVIGMISCLALSEYLNARFYISWNDFNLNDYFYYSDYKYNNDLINVNKYYNHSLTELKETFFNKTANQINSLFACESLIINTNQNFWQYLNFEEMYETYTKRLFDKLFTIILIPKPIITNVTNKFNHVSVIGIQLRFGDVFMNTENMQINNPQYNHFPLGRNVNAIYELLNHLIKQHQNNLIFITSDINIRKYFNLSQYSNLILDNETPTHIERSVNKNNIIKCFLDFFMLCKCNKLFITEQSNFGRCPGIISGAQVYCITPTLEIVNTTITSMACK